MRSSVRSILCLAVVAVVVLCAETSYAQFWGYGGAYPALNPGIYVQERVPYFAQFPPVYYSHPVARTYGYSPYSYPPGVLTPGSHPMSPGYMVNSYGNSQPALATTETTRPMPILPGNLYSPEEAKNIAAQMQPPKPLLIKNPFVQDR